MGSRRDLAPDLFLSGAVGLSDANPMAATAPAALREHRRHPRACYMECLSRKRNKSAFGASRRLKER